MLYKYWYGWSTAIPAKRGQLQSTLWLVRHAMNRIMLEFPMIIGWHFGAQTYQGKAQGLCSFAVSIQIHCCCHRLIGPLLRDVWSWRWCWNSSRSKFRCNVSTSDHFVKVCQESRQCAAPSGILFPRFLFACCMWFHVASFCSLLWQDFTSVGEIAQSSTTQATRLDVEQSCFETKGHKILFESYWHVLDHIGSIFAHSVSFWHFGPWDLELPLSVRMLWRKWFSQQLKGAQDFCFTSQCHSWI